MHRRLKLSPTMKHKVESQLTGQHLHVADAAAYSSAQCQVLDILAEHGADA